MAENTQNTGNEGKPPNWRCALPGVVPGVLPPSSTNSLSRTNEEVHPQVTCTGWSQVPGDVLVFTSDGETYSVKNHEVDFIGRRAVRVMGHLMRIVRRPAHSEYVASVSPGASPVLHSQYYDETGSGSTVTVIPFGDRHDRNLLSGNSGRNLVQQRMQGENRMPTLTTSPGTTVTPGY